MKVVAIIQARMGSIRLPGKVLLDIVGASMLARTVQRTQLASLIDKVVVATTVESADQAIVDECNRLQVPVFCGQEEDVLDRYFQAASAHSADTVVRITSDCPLVDAGVIDRVIAAFMEARPDYASNTLERRYPRGLDTEVMSIATLERAWRQAAKPYQRSHVTPFIYENPDLFDLLSVTSGTDYSHHRWTVDTPEDLALIRAVYERLGTDYVFGWEDMSSLIDSAPDLFQLNREIPQKPLHVG